MKTEQALNEREKMEDSLYCIIINRIKDECGFNKDECNDLIMFILKRRCK